MRQSASSSYYGVLRAGLALASQLSFACGADEPARPSGSGETPGAFGDRIDVLNQRIVGWAADNSLATSPIVVVDQHTGYDAAADNRDGVHPRNDIGSQKMADRWYAALAPLF